MASIETEFVELPYEVVKNSGGFSLEIGDFVVKLAYQDKRDWDYEHGQPRKVQENLARVRVVTFPRQKRQETIRYIREYCHINQVTRDHETSVYITGSNCHEYIEEIGRELNIRLKYLKETDCFVRSFQYFVKNKQESKLLHQVPEIATAKFRKGMKQMLALLQNVEGNFDMTSQSHEEQTQAVSVQEGTDSKDDRRAYSEKQDIYPCLVAKLGSGNIFIKVDADGTSRTIDVSHRGGRAFLGLGRIVTGAQNYGQLMEMAEEGDCNNVHIYGRDLKVRKGEDHLYSDTPQDVLYFCFGKGMNKPRGSFKKEDLARALLQVLCMDIAQMTYLVLKAHNIKKVFLCGGFGDNELVRELLTEEFLLRSLFRGEVGQREARFVKNGIYLGAIGAFLGE